MVNILLPLHKNKHTSHYILRHRIEQNIYVLQDFFLIQEHIVRLESTHLNLKYKKTQPIITLYFAVKTKYIIF